MATVQQLEKLHHVQRLFYVDDSLEACVAGERVAATIKKTEQLIKQRAYLREERRRLRVSSEQLEDRKVALKTLQEKDWLPSQLKSAAVEKRIQMNIGGLMFECPVSVLRRDPNSILAQLTYDEPSVTRDPEGFFAFDRDWWLFRYILIFMRDGSLPEDRALLAQLYREAAFWQLSELQRAIEEEKLLLRTTKRQSGTQSSSSSGEEKKEEVKKWWKKLPSWQESVQKAELEAKEKSKKKTDWWTGTTYHDKTFLPLPRDPTSGRDARDSGVKEDGRYDYSDRERERDSSRTSGHQSASANANFAKGTQFTSATWFVPEDRRGRGGAGGYGGAYGASSGGGYGGGSSSYYGGGGGGGGGTFGGGSSAPYTREQLERLTQPVRVNPLPAGAGGGVLAPRVASL